MNGSAKIEIAVDANGNNTNGVKKSSNLTSASTPDTSNSGMKQELFIINSVIGDK